MERAAVEHSENWIRRRTLFLSLPFAVCLLKQERIPLGARGVTALGSLGDGGRAHAEALPQGHSRIPVALDGQGGNPVAGARDGRTPAPLREGGRRDAGHATEPGNNRGRDTGLRSIICIISGVPGQRGSMATARGKHKGKRLRKPAG